MKLTIHISIVVGVADANAEHYITITCYIVCMSVALPRDVHTIIHVNSSKILTVRNEEMK